MISKKTVMTLVILLLFLGIIYAPQKYFAVKSYAMSLYPDNTDPYGTSLFVNMLKEFGFKVIYGNTSQLKKLGKGDVYILLGPDNPLTNEEISEVENFLDNGGELLIADELGIVNNLLGELFKAEIDMDYVNETLSKYKSETGTANITNSTSSIEVKAVNIGQLEIPPFSTYNRSCEDIANRIYNISKDENRVMYYIPSLPSYFKKIGSGNISGILYTLNTSTSEYECLPFSIAYENKLGGRAYIIADTYLFTNYFISNTKNLLFYKELFKWLVEGDIYNRNISSITTKQQTIVIDIGHYKPIVVKRPLPKMGELFLGMLNDVFSNMKSTYNGTISRIPAEIILIGIIISIVSLYFTFKTRIKVPSSEEGDLPYVIEKELVGESAFLRKLRMGKTSKEFYKNMITGLYELFDYILNESISIRISEIYSGGLPSNIASLFNEHERRMLLKTAKRLYLLKKKIDEKKILPLVISWKRMFNKLSFEVDAISRKLGYVIMSMEEGKKIEYLVK